MKQISVYMSQKETERTVYKCKRWNCEVPSFLFMYVEFEKELLNLLVFDPLQVK